MQGICYLKKISKVNILTLLRFSCMFKNVEKVTSLEPFDNEIVSENKAVSN